VAAGGEVFAQYFNFIQCFLRQHLPENFKHKELSAGTEQVIAILAPYAKYAARADLCHILFLRY